MRHFSFIVVFLSLTISLPAKEVAYNFFYRNYYEYETPQGTYANKYALFNKNLTNGQFQEREYVRYWDMSCMTSVYEVNFEPSYISSDWRTMTKTEYELKYTEDIIYSDRQTVTNDFFPSGSVRKDKIYLVALPLKSGPRTWTEVQNGTKYTCKAEWAYLQDDYLFLQKVIKITKNYVEDGFHAEETYYWGRGYGLLWQTLKTNSRRTIISRTHFGKFSEISEKEYTSEFAWREFCEEAKGVKMFLELTSPKAYEELVDEFANQIVNHNYKVGRYYNSNGGYRYCFEGHSDRLRDFIEDNIELPHLNIMHHCSVNIDAEGEITVSTNHDFFNKDWAKNRLKQSSDNGTYEAPYKIEPISKKKYIYPTDDAFYLYEDIDCFVFKIKKSRNSYKLVSGDQAVWDICYPALDIESISATKEKNTFYIRVMRFSCNGIINYSLLKCAAYEPGDRDTILCELEKLNI